MRHLKSLSTAVALTVVLAAAAHTQQPSAEEQKAVDAIRESGGWAGQSPDPKNPEKFAQLTGTRADDSLMKLLKDISGLKRVTLRDTAVTADGLAQLRQCKDLQGLTISGDKVTGKHLEVIVSLKRLRELEIYGTEMTDGDLERLTALENLEQLSVGKVSDKGVATLAKFKRLRVLVFYGAPLTEEALSRLSALASLEELSAVSPDVTDAAVKQLKEFKKLRRLSLVSLDMTDAGLKRLADLKTLGIVQITHSKLSSEARREFRKAFPLPKPGEGPRVEFERHVALLERDEIKIDPKDDELRKLLTERYNASIQELKGLQEQVRAGKIAFSNYLEAGKRLAVAGLELEEAPEKQFRFLQEYLELTRAIEDFAEEQYDAGSMNTADYQMMKCLRLDAEIQVLRLKRKVDSTKPK
jgi:hypothetical protein